MKKIFWSALLTLSASAMFAAEVIEIKEQKDWAEGAFVKKTADGAWQIPGARGINNAKAFKIDPAKSYTLSFDIRKSADTQSVLVYVGYNCLDADMVRIDAEHVRCEKNTAATLTADAAKGSKTIRMMLPRRWKQGGKHWCISFKSHQECAGNDQEVIEIKSQGEQAADGSVEITLFKPLARDYKAGTAIHCHSKGPGMYSVCNEKNPSTEWENVSVTISGQQTVPGIPSLNKWWIGAKYAKLFFLVVTRERTSKIEFRNIKLTIE